MIRNPSVGCPANEANEEGLTPQKIAKTEGFKDAMKEAKKLSSFQDKAARGAKPKGFAEPWCVRVSHRNTECYFYNPQHCPYTSSFALCYKGVVVYAH